jgi:hypothetical protein
MNNQNKFMRDKLQGHFLPLQDQKRRFKSSNKASCRPLPLHCDAPLTDNLQFKLAICRIPI